METPKLEKAEDYGFSFSDEELSEKLNAVFPDNETMQMKAFAANVLIGNIPAKKVNECVGDTFDLCGFYSKEVLFKDQKKGTFTYLFGRSNNECCAYCTFSDKVYDALNKIKIVYGEPTIWKQSISIRIRMNIIDKDNKAYSLEIL